MFYSNRSYSFYASVFEIVPPWLLAIPAIVFGMLLASWWYG